MSILIKGMKMPKAGKRPLWVVVHPDGVVEYDSGDYGWQTTKACEVSTPHGRLIDADDLMHEFAKFVRASNNSDFAPVPTWNDAVSLLGSAPTIIEAEENNHE